MPLEISPTITAMRFLKAALIALLVVAVVAAGAGAYLLSRIDREALVRRAQAAVKEATGRTLDIGGTINLRFSFAPAIVAERVRFSNASWGSRPDMARARRVEAELDLIALFTGTIGLSRLVVIEPDVLLETDARGRANWNFDKGKAAAKPANGAAPSLPAIELGALRITDGVFVYRDGARNTQTRVEIGTLDRKSAGLGRLHPIAVEGSLNGRAFELKGRISNPAALLAPGETFALDFKITARSVEAGAKGRLTDALGRADVQVQTQIEADEVQDLAALVDRRIPPLGPLKARATIERDKGRLGVRDLDLALGRPGALQVSARGSIRDLLKPAGAALEFSASAPKTERAPEFHVTGRLEDFKDGVRASGLKIVSGANELKGALEYRAGKDRPHVVTSLEGASLDLAFLAEAPDGGATSGEPASKGPVFTRDPLPLGQLRVFDADARVSVGALVLPNRVTLRDFKAALEVRGGKLRLEPVEFLAGGGRTTASLSVDASGDAAHLRGRLEGRRIVMGDLLAPTALGDKIKGGPTDIDVGVETRGISPHEWAAGLNGNVRVQIGEGQAKAQEIHYGSDVLTKMAEAINPFRKTDPVVRLQCAVLRLPITGGVFRSDRSIGAETNKMSVLSSGTIDLGKEVMDINLRPRVKEGIGLGGASLAKMVRVTGPLTDPKLGVDFGGVVGTTASIAAGLATGGLSLLGEKLLDTATAESACKVALGAAGTQPAAPAGASRAKPPAEKEPAAEGSPARKDERGLFDRVFGR